jgi:hypothetical protein
MPTHSPLATRLDYFRRVFAAYLTGQNSHLTFWHETPKVNSNLRVDRLGEYYMTFFSKADYPGPHDASGTPLLNYHGRVGRQYNPIAIAQYALGNYNLYCRAVPPGTLPVFAPKTGGVPIRPEAVSCPPLPDDRRARFLHAAKWLLTNLEENQYGLSVWNHHFDWHYRTPLKAPWYSGLAQGQGLSVLLRAHLLTCLPQYLEAAHRVIRTFRIPVQEGGVTYLDESGYVWFEEAIVAPPTHILNGFLWAAWGIYDYWLRTGEPEARKLFDEAVRTLRDHLADYDTGYWSLYEHSGTALPMLASPYYHRLTSFNSTSCTD